MLKHCFLISIVCKKSTLQLYRVDWNLAKNVSKLQKTENSWEFVYMQFDEIFDTLYLQCIQENIFKKYENPKDRKVQMAQMDYLTVGENLITHSRHILSFECLRWSTYFQSTLEKHFWVQNDLSKDNWSSPSSPKRSWSFVYYTTIFSFRL